jgi:hypothetical protein
MSDALATRVNDRGSHDERRLTAHWPTIKPAPVEAVVSPAIEIKGRVLAEIADYDGLWSAVRVRLEAMGITRREFDHLTGLQEGYSGKLLGAAQRRRFGKESLGATLGGICCKLVLVEDPEATAKMLARAKKRRLPLRPLKLLAPPRAAASHEQA